MKPGPRDISARLRVAAIRHGLPCSGDLVAEVNECAAIHALQKGHVSEYHSVGDGNYVRPRKMKEYDFTELLRCYA